MTIIHDSVACNLINRSTYIIEVVVTGQGLETTVQRWSSLTLIIIKFLFWRPLYYARVKFTLWFVITVSVKLLFGHIIAQVLGSLNHSAKPFSQLLWMKNFEMSMNPKDFSVKSGKNSCVICKFFYCCEELEIIALCELIKSGKLLMVNALIEYSIRVI